MIQIGQMLNDLEKERERINLVIEYIEKYHANTSVKEKRKKVLKHVNSARARSSKVKRTFTPAQRNRIVSKFIELKKTIGVVKASKNLGFPNSTSTIYKWMKEVN